MYARPLICLTGILISLCAIAPSQAASWRYRIIASEEAGSPGNYTWFNVPAINDKGEVAFSGEALANGNLIGGAWLSRSAKAPKLLYSFNSIGWPPGPPSINKSGWVTFGEPLQNAQGYAVTIIVRVTSAGVTVYPTAYNGGVNSAITDAGNVLVQTGCSLLLLSGATSTVVNSGTCDDNSDIASNGVGEVVYSNRLPSNIYVTNSATATTKLWVKDFGSKGSVGQPSINDLGTVAFLGTQVASQTGSNISALYTKSSAGKVRLVNFVNNGTCSDAGPPGGVGSCTNVSYIGTSMNASGAVVVSTDTENWVGTTVSSTFGVVLNGDLENGTVFANGTVVDGCTIKGAGIGEQAINASGQIAALIGCSADNTGRIVVATPSP